MNRGTAAARIRGCAAFPHGQKMSPGICCRVPATLPMALAFPDGTLGPTLLSCPCLTPVFGGPAVRAALMLPQEISALADRLVYAVPRGGHDMQVVPVGSDLAAPWDMHPGGQVSGASRALGLGSRFQRPPFVFPVVQGTAPFDRDRKRVQDGPAPAQNVNQPLGHLQAIPNSSGQPVSFGATHTTAIPRTLAI